MIDGTTRHLQWPVARLLVTSAVRNLGAVHGVQPTKGFPGMSRRKSVGMFALSLVAAALASVLAYRIAPDGPVGAMDLLVRAIGYVAVVFAAAGLATYLLPWSRLGRDRACRKGIALRVATVGVWLPPLLMFCEQRSWLALLLWIAVVVEVTHLTAVLVARSRSFTPAVPATPPEYFAGLKQDLPYGTSILAASLMQGAIFAAIANRGTLAGLLYLLGTVLIAYRSFQMFRDFGPGVGSESGRTAYVFGMATFLVVFAWLPYLASGPGNGSGSQFNSSAQVPSAGAGESANKGQIHSGSSLSALEFLKSLFHPSGSKDRTDSFSVAKRILGSKVPHAVDRKGALPKADENTNIAALISGPGFPGVELYPEVEVRTKLVAPPLHPNGAGRANSSDPLSIPFDGVYWLWRGPSSQAPSNSVVMHGSPSARFFRSSDGEGMSMEAKQNLGFAVRPDLYGAIELDIQNADPFPNSISILVKVRNTRLTAKPAQWLGMKDVATPAPSTASPSHQTLRFSIPPTLTMGTFDELTVTYYLKGERVNRSARIAIDRFRLVPRGA